MGRFRGIAEEGGEVSIEMAPLIDCTFILLIFFIVTTTFVEESGLEVDKPTAASAVQLEKTSIILAVTAKGEVVYGGKSIGLGGVRPLVARALQKEDVPVIVQADASVQAGLLVRVIDEAKLGGAKKVSLASNKPQT